jgi:uncharacterized protein YigA (DUF484 family)
MEFLSVARNDALKIQVDTSGIVSLIFNTVFRTHNGLKSHTDKITTLGEGAIQPISTKQKLNSRISTIIKSTSIDDILSRVLKGIIFGRNNTNTQHAQEKESATLKNNRFNLRT